MYKDKIITVIIPALNEESSIAKVLEDLPCEITDQVVVVDNGSTDRTVDVAKSKGARVLNEPKRGYGAACLRGLSIINETDIIVILDADYSDYPDQICRLLDPITAKEADFVLGSRVLGNREAGALAPAAYWGNKLTTFLIWLLYGYKYTDMGPFRAIKYESLKALAMTDQNWGWNVEMQIKALKAGLRIEEVPVDYRKRIGKSKISGNLPGIIKAGAKIIYSVFKYLFYSQNVLIEDDKTKQG